MVGDDKFPPFDVKSKSAQIHNPLYGVGVGDGVGDDQFLTFDAESKSAKIQIPKMVGRGGGASW